MRERKVAPSIWRSMVQSVTLYILLPLFLALTVLCFLLKKKTDSGIEEAMQMMFAQNVQEIDSAILLSNYASSTMITYMENSRFLKNSLNQILKLHMELRMCQNHAGRPFFLHCRLLW